MSKSSVPRRAPRPATRDRDQAADATRKILAASERDLRRAATLLRTTFVMTIDTRPVQVTDFDYATVARQALELLKSAEAPLGEIPMAVKEWRAIGHVQQDLFNAHDALVCALVLLDSGANLSVYGKMNESAPGGAFQCVAYVLGCCIARLSNIYVQMRRRSGA